VERRFRELTDQAVRSGVFCSVPALIAAIGAYLAAHSKDPKPFVWTTSAEEILQLADAALSEWRSREVAARGA
jgi:hypothetical protein